MIYSDSVGSAVLGDDEVDDHDDQNQGHNHDRGGHHLVLLGSDNAHSRLRTLPTGHSMRDPSPANDTGQHTRAQRQLSVNVADLGWHKAHESISSVLCAYKQSKAPCDARR